MHELITSDLCDIDFDLSLSRGRSKNNRRKDKSCNNGRAAHDHAPFRGRAKTSLPDRALIIDTAWPPLAPVLASIASRSFFLSGQLYLGNLSETVVIVRNTPHDHPSFLVCHLIGNRASFLCTEAPMLRVPETNFLQGITSISGARCSGDLPSSPPTDYRSRHQHRSYRVPWSRCIF